MMDFVEYKPEHAKAIIAAGAVGPYDYQADNMDELIEMKTNGWAVTALENGVPVACGGAEIIDTETYQAWGLFVKGLNKRAHRQFKKLFLKLAKETGSKTLIAPLRPDWRQGINYVKYLGFKFDRVLKGVFNDTDALLYTLGV